MNKNLLRILIIGAICVILVGSGVLFYEFVNHEDEVTQQSNVDKDELYQAIIGRNTDIYTKYINDGADLSFAFEDGPNKGKTPLELLVQSGDLMNAQKIIDNGFDLSKVNNNHIDTLTSLISYNNDFYDPAVDQMTIQLIAQIKDEIEEGDSWDYSILMNTITTDNTLIIEEILKYIDNIDKVYNEETALSYACNIGFDNLDVIKELVDKGADINYQGYQGYNCLMNAISTHQNETVEYLLGLPGLDINAVNEFGQTALHLCVEYSNLYAIDLLLQNTTIDQSIEDEYGLTAKEFADQLVDDNPDVTEFSTIADKL